MLPIKMCCFHDMFTAREVCVLLQPHCRQCIQIFVQNGHHPENLNSPSAAVPFMMHLARFGTLSLRITLHFINIHLQMKTALLIHTWIAYSLQVKRYSTSPEASHATRTESFLWSSRESRTPIRSSACIGSPSMSEHSSAVTMGTRWGRLQGRPPIPNWRPTRAAFQAGRTESSMWLPEASSCRSWRCSRPCRGPVRLSSSQWTSQSIRSCRMSSFLTTRKGFSSSIIMVRVPGLFDINKFIINANFLKF